MAGDETRALVVRQAAELQKVHQADVAANLVRSDSLWAKPCRAYNLHILPSAPTRDALGHAQAQLASIEPGLLACPADSLHVSVAWLLAVHADYGMSKDRLWATEGDHWTEELAAIAAETSPFSLRYARIVATDSAIIVLAAPTRPVNHIRERIRDRVELPPQTRNSADLVHTTLCRYGDKLTDPAKLLAKIGETRLHVSTDVDALVVSQERVYPSLDARVLARLAFGGLAPGKASG